MKTCVYHIHGTRSNKQHEHHTNGLNGASSLKMLLNLAWTKFMPCLLPVYVNQNLHLPLHFIISFLQFSFHSQFFFLCFFNLLVFFSQPLVVTICWYLLISYIWKHMEILGYQGIREETCGVLGKFWLEWLLTIKVNLPLDFSITSSLNNNRYIQYTNKT